MAAKTFVKEVVTYLAVNRTKKIVLFLKKSSETDLVDRTPHHRGVPLRRRGRDEENKGLTC